jgi:hypothetical protein
MDGRGIDIAELVLVSVLDCIYDTVNALLRGQVEAATMIDNLELVLLTIDEVGASPYTSPYPPIPTHHTPPAVHIPCTACVSTRHAQSHMHMPLAPAACTLTAVTF